MLASNQPYQRVDDGVGAGFVGGALAGGAAAGAAHKWGAKGLSALSNVNNNTALTRSMGTDGEYGSKYNKIARQHEAAGNGIQKASSLHKKGFAGGWKGKAAAYGGSVLAGGLLGAGLDAAND